MKKILTAFVCAIVFAVSMFGLAACGDNNTPDGEKAAVSVYMPDGAPALAAAKLMAGEASFDREVNYNVVDSTVIQTYVSGNSPKADLCILPVNTASKILGSGSTYKMLGTVTHGNLFLLKKAAGEDITLDNLESLKGKTVGVIKLADIPGLTIKLILNDNGIAYNELGNSGTVASDKVNLKAVTAVEVLPTDATCDYFVVPEPAATTKVNATGGKLSFAGNLQTLYGSENGYPQAVLVAKNSLIESDPEFINKFMQAVTDNADWLLSESVSAETIINAVQSHLTEGMTPTFTSANLSKSVIENSAINFVKSADCKTEVNAFIDKLIAVSADSASRVDDGFYYIAQ